VKHNLEIEPRSCDKKNAENDYNKRYINKKKKNGGATMNQNGGEMQNQERALFHRQRVHSHAHTKIYI